MRRQGLPRGSRDLPPKNRGANRRVALEPTPTQATKTTPSVKILDVLDLAGRGDGVCRLDDGAVVLVPGAVPGDRVEVALEPARAGVQRGRILRILTASPDRQLAPCPVASRCGGCTWLHVSLPRQRLTKAELARRALSVLPTATPDAAAADPADAARPMLVGDTPLLGWRRRARLHLRRQGDVLAIGLLQAQSDALVAVASCPQLEPALGAWLPRWRRDLEPWVERGEVSATLGAAGVVVQVHGVGRRDDAGSNDDALEAMLRAWMQRPVAAGAPILGVNLVLGDRQFTLGASHVWLTDRSADEGREPWGSFASAAGFSQASARGNAAIRTAVDRTLQALVERRGGRFAWAEELYAGSGNLTPLLAQASAELRSVEFDADAVSRAEAARDRWSVQLESLRRAELRTGDAGQVPLRADEDAVWLLDPGRPGAADVIARAVAEPPGALVYVSCAPDTLRRDLSTLAAAGWTAITSFWIDSMPATPHLEIVVAAIPPRLDGDRARC
jgi:23S rRNA (uracil1939-C5)-methyltransferase